MCSHPRPHKLKDYGFAEEILCPECWTSLKVKPKESYVRGKWVKRFLNNMRSWLASKEEKLISTVKMPDGRLVVKVGKTYFVRSLARELHMDEETLWKYALLFEDKNVDGILKPTTIPYNGEHLAIQIIPAPRECKVWPYSVSDLAIHSVECNRVVGRARDFTVKVWLDYYFDEPTQVFIGVGDETEGLLGQHEATLVGESTSFPYAITAKPPSKLCDCNLVVFCFYLEGGKWTQADSTTLKIRVEDIKTSGWGAIFGGIIGALASPPPLPPLTAFLCAIAGDSFEYEAIRSERERQLKHHTGDSF